MKIAVGSDHAGFKLKETIKNSIAGVEFIDVGAFSEESTDYPDHIGALSRLVQRGEADRGIGICGTGVGASITANKFGGIRAALCTNAFMAEMSRRHNDSNILILGARVTEDAEAVTITRTWIETPFEGGRHQRRLDKIKAIECGG
ncbi:MAG TPA: ribose 5-phosphate isomerase B [Spirochaetota bacterium]|nr:ribose 5-phosphate isomerase B [Spirochaetota bacterium]